MKAQQAQTELRLKDSEARKLQAEMDLLKSQVNPHFLFNTLNNIYSLIIEKSELAGNSVIKLSNLMRYVLESTKVEKVPLSKEIGFIEDFIDLERIRLEDSCEIIFETGDTTKNKHIAPLIFIPLVENCFKHGIGVKKENNKIKIRLKTDGDKISFSTENYIAPKRMDAKTQAGQNGISNLKKG